jgi:hypothetical protein
VTALGGTVLASLSCIQLIQLLVMVLDHCEVKGGDKEVIDLGITLVNCPPYIFYQGSLFTNYISITISNKNPIQPVALLML